MRQCKMCSIFSFFVLCLVILSSNGTQGTKWNTECENQNYCYKLLNGGAKYTWPEALNLCRNERGYLLTDSWITVTENFQLLQKLVNNSDTWTSLQLVNGFIQEVANYTSYSSYSEELWEKHSVWENDMCVKLTKGRKLQATNCLTKLPVVCTSDLGEIREPALDCDVQMKPILTVGGLLERSVDIQGNSIEIKEDEKDDIIFRCESANRNARIDWIKDGVYLKRRIATIQPAITVDPSKIISSENVKGYNIQGTYWCEVWIPGCSRKFSSNKMDLIFENVITTHLNFHKNAGNLDDNEIAEKVRMSFQSCLTQESEYQHPDIRRGYTNANDTMIATLNFFVYLNSNATNCDADDFISEAKKQLSALDIVKHGVSSQPKCKKKNTLWKRATGISNNCTLSDECRTCPPHYFLQAPYCVHVTEPGSWRDAYQKCYQTGIEKTPFDHKDFWMNTTLMESFICSLKDQNTHSVWLAAERKFDFGPLYYSGPVESDFNYLFNEIDKYNISWTEDDFGVNNKCLALNVVKRKLRILSCEEQLAFVCIFPSEFWTQNITYDTFQECRSDCGGSDSFGDIITWRQALESCVKEQGDLMDANATNFAIKIENNDHIVLKKYIGKQNSRKPSVKNSSSWHKFTEWLRHTSEPIESIYQKYRGTFLFNGTNEDSKVYACLEGKNHTVPKLIHVKDKDRYTIELRDAVEVNVLFGTKCYLNGRSIGNVLNVHRHGYMFCEVLTHLPTMLLRSQPNIIAGPISSNNLNVDSRSVSFACQIFDPNQSYNFKLHDLSFKSITVGSVSYYEIELSKKLNYNYYVTVDKITRKGSGIHIDFHIEHSSDESNLMKLYKNISTSFLPVGKNVNLGSRIVSVVYLRNTKYCMEEEVFIDPNTSNCTEKATWPRMPIGKRTYYTLERCVKCDNVIMGRKCKGSFSTGAEWISYNYRLSDINTVICKENDALEKAKELIDETVTSVLQGNITVDDTHNLTNNFLIRFESLLKNKIVNGSYNNNNETVYIYSSPIENNIVGYVYNGHVEKPEIRPVGKDEIDKNDAVAVFISHNTATEEVKNTTILISVFENSNIFPNRTENHLKISPVLLVKVPERLNVTFPVKVFFKNQNYTENDENILCTFWNEETNKWDKSGSRYIGTNFNGFHECWYDHLSSFTLVLQVEGDATLSIISVVGCFLSLVGLALVLITFIAFRKYRTFIDSKVIASLSFSLFMTYFIFVTGFTQTTNKILCIIIAACLHYFVLASFCWMLVEAFHNYLKFVKVIGTYIPRFMWKASALAWGLPLVPVITMLSHNYELYVHQEYCWIDKEVINFYLIIPVGLISGTNLIFFLVIIISVSFARRLVLPSKNNKSHSLIIGQLKMSFCMFMLLGLSWFFGFISVLGGGIVFSYLFCITSTLQGFAIFIFFIVQERRARISWRMLLHEVTSDHVPSSAVRTHSSSVQSAL